jgi:hypothetical protein
LIDFFDVGDLPFFFPASLIAISRMYVGAFCEKKWDVMIIVLLKEISPAFFYPYHKRKDSEPRISLSNTDA